MANVVAATVEVAASEEAATVAMAASEAAVSVNATTLAAMAAAMVATRVASLWMLAAWADSVVAFAVSAPLAKQGGAVLASSELGHRCR